jgi:hypothetical protein
LNRIRWIAQSRYAAAKITPVAAMTERIGAVRNEPISTRNSPMNPFVPGSPMLLSETNVSSTANIGTTRAIPPYASIIRECLRS